MGDKIFLDTNIFVYSIDTTPGEKLRREVSQELVEAHIRNETGVVSIQVLQEFYQVSTQKIKRPLSTEQALEYMHYISILEIVHPDFDMIVTAIRLHRKYNFPFWDALILQASKTAGCSQVLSEDLQDGFRIGNLTVRNPYLKEFEGF